MLFSPISVPVMLFFMSSVSEVLFLYYCCKGRTVSVLLKLLCDSEQVYVYSLASERVPLL